MSRDIAVGLYANRRYVPSPNTDWPRVLQYARSHNADYLVASSGELTGFRPQLSFLLETGAPELELVFSFEESERRWLVYRISPSSTKSTSTAGRGRPYQIPRAQSRQASVAKRNSSRNPRGVNHISVACPWEAAGKLRLERMMSSKRDGSRTSRGG